MNQLRLLLLLACTAAACTTGGGPVPVGDDASTATDDANMGPNPTGGAIGPHGGTVDRLFFAFHGDTRPGNCDDTANYPTAVIQNIFKREAAAGVQFTVDLGDHMFVCANSLPMAKAQMKIYTDAMKLLPSQTFMTMGNHECSFTDYCPANSPSPNTQAYMAALAPVSPLPYYTFDVMTHSGKATFVIIADNAWDAAQQTWLQTTLTTADKSAKYTIVARHHPVDNTQLSNSAVWGIVKQHKYTLFLTGHTHEYKHDTYSDRSGRTLRIGIAGAPLDPSAAYHGYGTVQQGLDDKMYVTIYDVASNMPQDTFTVSPQ